MADAAGNSILAEAALVSGLLTQEQLDEALRAASTAAPGPPLPADQIGDELLANQVVELGMLNRWQTEQLKQGRTKFTLGPYHVIDSIGQGGMGHVFKAEHSMLGRIEAVKVLPKSRTTPESIASFHREIRAQAQLDHPNLVRLSYAGQDGSTWFFVTEYVPGTDLRRLVRKRGPLGMQEAGTVCSQAARGLQYAHERGLVHRDIKPGNLLVTPDGRTKVTDLGLAGFLTEDDEQADDPRAGKIVGTADYLAPETIRSPGDVRGVSDIYSLGCTLYYAVTGKVPFPGGTTAEKLHRHCKQTPLNPQRFNQGLDEAFLEVLAGMMEKDPDARVPTAAEVIERLGPWTLERVPSPLEVEETAKQPGRRPAARPIPVSQAQMDDTEPHFLDSAMEIESPSQASQGTVPVASEETRPIVTAPRPLRTAMAGLRQAVRDLWGQRRSLLVPVLLALAIAITLGVLAVALLGR